MNDILKQRLVGALILLALGVVFWPIIFVQPEDRRSVEQATIPVPPVVPTAAVEAPTDAGLRGSPELAVITDSVAPDAPVEPSGPASQVVVGTPPTVAAVHPGIQHANAATTPATPGVRSEPPKPLSIDANGVPVAWTLQVATVSSAEKADTLRRQLLDRKLKAYVATVSSGGKRLYRVCIGPKFERAELEKMQSAINAEFGVTTMVARYVP